MGHHCPPEPRSQRQGRKGPPIGTSSSDPMSQAPTQKGSSPLDQRRLMFGGCCCWRTECGLVVESRPQTLSKTGSVGQHHPSALVCCDCCASRLQTACYPAAGRRAPHQPAFPARRLGWTQSRGGLGRRLMPPTGGVAPQSSRRFHMGSVFGALWGLVPRMGCVRTGIVALEGDFLH